MDGKAAKDSTLVERWIEDQREWQKTAMAYLDAMVKNDDFLVHLGNAMRGSLLAGKPYPSAPASPPPTPQEPPPDDRLDRVLFALHELQGQITDLRLTLDEMRGGGKRSSRTPTPSATRPAPAKATSARAKVKSTKAARTGKSARAGKTTGRARG
jgi:hypothetical protein